MYSIGPRVVVSLSCKSIKPNSIRI